MKSDDLISRSALLEQFGKCEFLFGCMVHVIIKEAPAVDAEPVIRCNACKHYETDTGFCYYHGHGMDWDGFCSRGKNMDAEVEYNA